MNGLVFPSASLLSDISPAAKPRRSSASNDAKLRGGEDEKRKRREREKEREARPCVTKDPHQPHRVFCSGSYYDNRRETRTRGKTLSVSSYLCISVNATLTWRSKEWHTFNTGRNGGLICVPERDEQ